MRAKFINEKFEEDSDPIHDLGIGYKNRNFTNTEEFLDFLVQNISHILKTHEIPKDIINSSEGIIRTAYFRRIQDFLINYNIKYNDIKISESGCKVYFWPTLLRFRLEENGFSKLD